MLRRLARPFELLRRYRRDRKGSTAIEFAMIAPIMVTTYLATVEAGHGYATARKTTIVARTIADLAGQDANISTAELNDIFAAGQAVIFPHRVDMLGMVLTCIQIDANRQARVTWSRARGLGAVPATAGSSVTLDNGVLVPNTVVIMATARYLYEPPVATILTGPVGFERGALLRPRTGTATCATVA